MRKTYNNKQVEYTQACGSGENLMLGNRVLDYDIVCSS